MMQDYVKYLKNVLGVNQILDLKTSAYSLSESQSEGSSTQTSNFKITVWVENLDSFSNEDHALLTNMLAAMKIPSMDMAVLDYSLKGSSFSPIEFDLVLKPDNSNHQTYSPQVLHAQKNLKSVVWTFLQQVMQKYKSLS